MTLLATLHLLVGFISGALAVQAGITKIPDVPGPFLDDVSGE